MSPNNASTLLLCRFDVVYDWLGARHGSIHGWRPRGSPCDPLRQLALPLLFTSIDLLIRIYWVAVGGFPGCARKTGPLSSETTISLKKIITAGEERSRLGAVIIVAIEEWVLFFEIEGWDRRLRLIQSVFIIHPFLLLFVFFGLPSKEFIRDWSVLIVDLIVNSSTTLNINSISLIRTSTALLKVFLQRYK